MFDIHGIEHLRDFHRGRADRNRGVRVAERATKQAETKQKFQTHIFVKIAQPPSVSQLLARVFSAEVTALGKNTNKSIQRLPVAFDADGQHDGGEERDGPQLARDIRQAVAFQ